MNKKTIAALAIAPWVLVACDMPAGPTGGTPTGPMTEVPERVMQMAAPYQNLATVRVDPVDGCYVYQHVGPVETTFLPLRTNDGRPICTRAPGEPAPAS